LTAKFDKFEITNCSKKIINDLNIWSIEGYLS
jgi:hypothetical protein